MEREEAKGLLDEFMQAWASWKPEEGELILWRSMLCRFDLAAAKKAMEAYWEECKTSKPVAANFKAKYAAMDPGQAVSPDPLAEGNPNGYAGVAVQCVKAAPSNPWQLGHYQPLYYGVPQAIPPHYRIMETAAELCQTLTRQYGGEWEIVQQASIAQMDARKRELRAQQWS